MEGLLSSKSLPPGFRFHPTDEELFMYYLKRKVLGKSLSPQMISEIDVYQFAPWELPAMAGLKTRDLNWFFFCPRAKKYPNGGRSNRATVYGYWKSTGNDRTMLYNSRPVGKIKTLIFHMGKAPKGERTDWVMHEYRLEDKVLADRGVPQDCYVICKIYKKSGLGPKNGEHYGARFVEEEWDSDDDDDDKVQESGLEPVLHAMGHACVGDSHGSVSVLTTAVDTPNVASPVDVPIAAVTAPAPSTPVPSADVSSPVITTASLGTPRTSAVSFGTPSTSAVSLGTPSTSAAYLGNPSTSAASLGNPYLGAASLGGPYTSAAAVGEPNITDASLGSVTASASASASVGSQGAVAACTELDLDMLLSFLTEFEDDGGIFDELGDLTSHSSHFDFSLDDVLFMDDLE